MVTSIQEKVQVPDRKVVVIGIDGVPCSLLEDYMEQGIMPHLREMKAVGKLLPMKSTLPEVSSVAWTSFMTGKNPAEHGIFGFMEVDRATYKYIFPNFLSLKVPPFWDDMGLPTIAINIPQTYPAKPVNGILVSGFVALDLEKAVYPRRIYDYLKARDYRLDVQSQLATKDPKAFFEDLFYTFEKRMEIIKHLFNTEEWHIFIGIITETDRLHHFFFDSARGGEYHDIFFKFYQKLDDFLWEMFNASCKSKAFFLTCSDHGFATVKTEVYVNRYLIEKGVLKLLDIKDLASIMPDSRAFCLDPARVYINLRDKYARGSVGMDEYNSKREEIRSIFETLTFEGEKVVRKVFPKEEIFYGEYFDNAPDLYILAEPGFDMKSSTDKHSVFGLSHFKGAHTYEDAHLYISDDRFIEKSDIKIEQIVSIVRKYLNGRDIIEREIV